jgi:DNA-binding response OmpR family regulator
MLTGKDAIRDKEEGFHAGADDYLTKPFHSQELIARLHALMRRPPAYSGNSLRVRDLVMDTHKRKVTRDNNEIQLQPMEFTLLEFLMRHAGEVFSSEVLMRRCWSADAEVSLDAIYTCIRRLRKKLDVEGKPSLINTVHGIGYGLDVDAD